MRRMLNIVVGSTMVLLLCSAALASAGTYEQNHDGINFGFGFGGGTAGLDIDGLGSSDREGSVIGNLRVGFPVNPTTHLAIESSGWSKSENGATVTFNALTAGVALFPSEGLVLRGGVGLGSTTASLTGFGSSTETGFGLHAAVGYDFRVAKTFAVGPQLDFGMTTFDGGSANWFGLGVNFNWYFIK